MNDKKNNDFDQDTGLEDRLEISFDLSEEDFNKTVRDIVEILDRKQLSDFSENLKVENAEKQKIEMPTKDRYPAVIEIVVDDEEYTPTSQPTSQPTSHELRQNVEIQGKRKRKITGKMFITAEKKEDEVDQKKQEAAATTLSNSTLTDASPSIDKLPDKSVLASKLTPKVLLPISDEELFSKKVSKKVLPKTVKLKRSKKINKKIFIYVATGVIVFFSGFGLVFLAMKFRDDISYRSAIFAAKINDSFKFAKNKILDFGKSIKRFNADAELKEVTKIAKGAATTASEINVIKSSEKQKKKKKLKKPKKTKAVATGMGVLDLIEKHLEQALPDLPAESQEQEKEKNEIVSQSYAKSSESEFDDKKSLVESSQTIVGKKVKISSSQYTQLVLFGPPGKLLPLMCLNVKNGEVIIPKKFLDQGYDRFNLKRGKKWARVTPACENPKKGICVVSEGKKHAYTFCK